MVGIIPAERKPLQFPLEKFGKVSSAGAARGFLIFFALIRALRLFITLVVARFLAFATGIGGGATGFAAGSAGFARGETDGFVGDSERFGEYSLDTVFARQRLRISQVRMVR